jgi:ubiquinone/menaquinone biosynthesis C-methylase UbiE
VAEQRRGEVFDGLAEAYDLRRSGYPREVVAAAMKLADLRDGSRVVEVGSGTGKLTEELVTCGLRVDAVDPGPNMIALARRRVRGSDLVHFHVGRFEEVELPEGRFDALFAASSFHWVDPQLGWAKAARVLRPGGTVALIQPVGVRAEASRGVLDELHAAFAQLAPEIAAELTPPRDEATIRAGAEERRDNISELWSWLSHPGLGVPEAGTLFGPAVFTSVPRQRAETADELWALFETTSVHHRLTAPVRRELRAEDARIIDAHGGVLRTKQLVALVTAQRR